jgi:hypothetical protein
VGYLRHDTEEELEILEEFFSPKTPYERLIESPYILEETKEELKALYEKLNPAELFRRVRGCQMRLYAENFRKRGKVPSVKLKIERGGLR